ncbi:MAG: hypothetical protein K2M17_03305 [Bacilli bacterium]|nr:hypothetical protein [Bacilli bacterium]
MESYILKNTERKEKVLLYQTKEGYSFTPKKGYRVKKVTVYPNSMIEGILTDKVISAYKRLLQIIYNLISSGDETTSGDVLVTYTEIDRLKGILLNKYYKYLKKEFIEEYLRKLHELETQLKNLYVFQEENKVIQNEPILEEQEEKGRGR